MGKGDAQMKKNALRTAVSLLLAACLLTGCARLLERSYSVVEPYADRYWDSSAEDTLRAESYQDLVNSMLLLIEQRAEEGMIRCYGESVEYSRALAAWNEVRQETMLGSYLLQSFRLSYEDGSGYGTLTCHIAYREDAEDIDSLMTLSDSQSLVDLLRLAVREEHEKLTAHFAYDTPREDVTAAVESLWQELCRSEMEAAEALNANVDALAPVSEEDGGGELEAEDGEAPEGEALPEPEPEPEEEASPEEEDPDAPPEEGEPGNPDGDEPEEPPEEPIVYPPCPWLIRFYPDKPTAEIVEVLLQT